MFVYKKANCISQLNKDYINAIHLELSFKLRTKFLKSTFSGIVILTEYFSQTKIILDVLINAIFQYVFNCPLYLCPV